MHILIHYSVAAFFKLTEELFFKPLPYIRPRTRNAKENEDFLSDSYKNKKKPKPYQTHVR